MRLTEEKHIGDYRSVLYACQLDSKQHHWVYFTFGATDSGNRPNPVCTAEIVWSIPGINDLAPNLHYTHTPRSVDHFPPLVI